MVNTKGLDECKEIEDSLSEVFLKNYDNLKRYALKITKNEVLSEDITQDVYTDIYQRFYHDDSHIENKLGFLFQAIKFASFKELKLEGRKDHGRVVEETHDQMRNDFLLEELILESIDNLPSQRKKAFYLRRILHYKVNDIAKEMGLQPKTVENHITLAIKSLQAKYPNIK